MWEKIVGQQLNSVTGSITCRPKTWHRRKICQNWVLITEITFFLYIFRYSGIPIQLTCYSPPCSSPTWEGPGYATEDSPVMGG